MMHRCLFRAVTMRQQVAHLFCRLHCDGIIYNVIFSSKIQCDVGQMQNGKFNAHKLFGHFTSLFIRTAFRRRFFFARHLLSLVGLHSTFCWWNIIFHKSRMTEKRLGAMLTTVFFSLPFSILSRSHSHTHTRVAHPVVRFRRCSAFLFIAAVDRFFTVAVTYF